MLRKKLPPIPQQAGRKLASQPANHQYQTLIFDGDRFFKNKEFATAFQIYQKACQLAPPGDNYPFAQLCRCYRKKAKKALKKENFEQVVQILEEMLVSNGERPNIRGVDHKILGQAYFELQDFAKAQSHLDLACQLMPELSESIQSMLNKMKAEKLHAELNQMGKFKGNDLKGWRGD